MLSRVLSADEKQRNILNMKRSLASLEVITLFKDNPSLDQIIYYGW